MDCAAHCGSRPRRGGLCPLCRQHMLNARTALRQAASDDAARDALYAEARYLAAELGGAGDTGRAARLAACRVVAGMRDTLRNDYAADGDDTPCGRSVADTLESSSLPIESGSERRSGVPTGARNFASALRRALRFPEFGKQLAAGVSGDHQSGRLPEDVVPILSGIWGRLWRYTG